MTDDALALARATLDAIGRERTELCELALQLRAQLAASDAEIERLGASLVRMRAAENRELQQQVAALREALQDARRAHELNCKWEDSVAQECDCGADGHNAIIDTALAATAPEGKP